MSADETLAEVYQTGRKGPRLDNRPGRLLVDENLIFVDTELLLVMFSKLVITRAEFMWSSKQFYYEALSPEFREIAEGEQMPLYVAEFHRKSVSDAPSVRFRLSESVRNAGGVLM